MKYSANSVWENKDEYDVAVVGAGHAGCEAALATARLGFKTVMFTVSVDSIALMPCNPNIGGSSKGHLVRELDALGGEMGKVIDRTFIQSKMLNSSKGPAVHSLRAQADKANYSRTMRQVLQKQENLDIRQMEVTELLTEDGKITGVQTYSGAIYRCRAVVLCTGTYLKARCIYGEISTHTGPNGLQSANYLTDSLKALGIRMYRFKTGTPARIDKNSIDFTKMEEQKGDERVVPFSFTTDPESVQIDQASCWLTYTNERTHEIIRSSFQGRLREQVRDTVRLLKIKSLSSRIRTDIRCSLNRREMRPRRCMWVECPAHCLRMFSMRCIGVFRDWNMQRL